MERTEKIEIAWAWARRVRRAAIRARRDEHAAERDPFRARPGHEAAFEEAGEAIRALDTILGELEAAHTEARREDVRRTAAQFRDLAADFLFGFGLMCLAALGPAAACVMAGATDPIIQASAVAGIALSLAMAAKTARR